MKLLAVVFTVAILATTYAQDPCSVDNCNPGTGCVCLNNKSPLPLEETPQFVVLTFDDSITYTAYTDLYAPLLLEKANPDGNPISATFFVPHRYSNYSVIHELYMNGFEIADNSITKTPEASYWAQADVELLVKEFGGQKQIINLFANIPLEDIKGARTPNLQLNGDVSIQAYIQSELQYDNSWPTSSTHPLFTYTLDFASSQQCLVATCPKETYPGFFIAPIINLQGNEGIECSAIAGCAVDGTAQELLDWLKAQFDRVHAGTKAPQTFLLSAGWFQQENTRDAFEQFLGYLATLSDVFLVSHDDVQRWMLNPVPLAEYTNPLKERNTECHTVTCELEHITGEHIWMGSCIPCPDVYPWLDNPDGMLD